MTTSKGLVKDSEDYKKVYELFRSGELDSMQYNAEALRTKMEWTQKYEKRAFTSSVERMVNQVRMEELAEVRRKHGKDKNKSKSPPKTANLKTDNDDDDDDDDISLSELIKEDWSTLSCGAQYVSNDEFPVLFEYVLWGWNDEDSNERVSVMIRLASGLSFEDNDVEVEILNPETEDTQALVTFKRSSAFTDPNWFYRMYRHHMHVAGNQAGQPMFSKAHSMMVGFNSTIKTEVKKCGKDTFSKMRIDIGVPCEEELSDAYVPKRIHVATELAPECASCRTVQEAIKAGMKCKKYLVFHLMGPRSKFTQSAAKALEDDETEWVYTVDSPTNQNQPAAAMPRSRAGKKHRVD